MTKVVNCSSRNPISSNHIRSSSKLVGKAVLYRAAFFLGGGYAWIPVGVTYKTLLLKDLS